jgi:hypothetical protein
MRIRRHLAVLAAAALAFWAPSIVPTPAGGDHGADTAYAHSVWHSWAPWPAVYVFAGAASVMANAAYVWHTQCRELSSQEAMTSTFLPIVGVAFDAQASKCRR